MIKRLPLWCRIFSVLSAILYLGNVTYRRKSSGRDEGLDVGPPEVLATLSDLLKVMHVFLLVKCLSVSLFVICAHLKILKGSLWKLKLQTFQKKVGVILHIHKALKQ